MMINITIIAAQTVDIKAATTLKRKPNQTDLVIISNKKTAVKILWIRTHKKKQTTNESKQKPKNQLNPNYDKDKTKPT